MHHANDRVEPEFAQCVARMAARPNQLEIFLERMVERQELDFDSRNDDMTNLEFDHSEDILGELILMIRDMAGSGRERDDAAYLLSAMA